MGKAKAITATARKLAILVYRTLCLRRVLLLFGLAVSFGPGLSVGFVGRSGPAVPVSSEAKGRTAQSSAPSTPPQLIDIIPASGPAGEAYPLTVTIRGTGFMPTGNVVEFGPVRIAAVPSREPGLITVSIPKSLPSKGEVPPLVLPPGEYRTPVTTTAGTSNTLTFTLTRGP